MHLATRQANAAAFCATANQVFSLLAQVEWETEMDHLVLQELTQNVLVRWQRLEQTRRVIDALAREVQTDPACK